MRALMVVVLAACQQQPAKQKVDETAEGKPYRPIGATRGDAAAVTEDAALFATATGYMPPDAVSAKLAKEAVKGFVLVSTRASLYPSAEAARKHEEATYYVSPYENQTEEGELVSLRVIADRGDVIEVSTGKPTAGKGDCEKPFKPPYDLTVFVRRDQLVMRSTAAQSARYADETFIAIDVGAAITATKDGLAWHSPAFAATKLKPREDQVAYGAPVARASTPLPPMPGDKLYCEDAEPKTLADMGPKHRPLKDLSSCGTYDPASISSSDPTVPAPKLDGLVLAWDGLFDETYRVHREPNKRVLADIETRCGRVRVIPDPGSIRSPPGTMAMEEDLWVAEQGPVTWQGGGPAGQYNGTKEIGQSSSDVVHSEIDHTLCLHILPITVELCHSDRNASRKRMMKTIE